MKEKIDKIKPLIYAIELRDVYTKGHSERVAIYASMFCKYLKFQEKQIEDIYFAGLLHDIGKIAIPDSVLLKPSILNPKEYEIIKYHPILSANLVEKMPEFSYLKDIVKHHHENFDGSGYPDRLKGERIPLLSRILSLADVFDALTTDRIYRDAFTLPKAVEIMEDMKHKFDPKLFSKFIEFIKEFSLIKKHFKMQESEEMLLEKLRNRIFFEDMLTGLLNKNALLLILRRAIETKFNVTLIKVNIKNVAKYKQRQDIYEIEKLMKLYSAKIKKEFKVKDIKEKLDKNSVYVFRDDGKFIFLGFSKDLEEKISIILKTTTSLEIEYEFIFKDKKLNYNYEKEIEYFI